MSNIWSRLDTLAGSAVNRTFAESVLVSPRSAASEYVEAGPDASRPGQAVMGVVSYEPDAEDFRGQRNSGENRGVARMAVSKFSVQLTAAVVVTIPYAIEAGDRVDLTDRAGTPHFAVEHISVLDCGDVVLHLTKETP